MFALDRALVAPPGPPVPPRARLSEVLARQGGNKSAAARELGVTRKRVYTWLRSSP
jgi:transcriptional regulator of acetoin/glycerol metabolism